MNDALVPVEIVTMDGVPRHRSRHRGLRRVCGVAGRDLESCV